MRHVTLGMTMRRLSERPRDGEEPHHPPEPENATGQFRNVPWRAESERRPQPHDPFSRFGVQDVPPPPPPPERNSFGFVRLLGLVGLVAAGSAHVVWTF